MKGIKEMMSQAEFRLNVKQINEQLQARHETATAWGDQEMARLFERCEWTQEAIAKEMKRTHQWVSCRLIFGRFLDLATTVANTELAGLTERRFRDYWRKTEGAERERFAKVAEILANGIPQGFEAVCNKTGARKAVLAAMDDGK